MSFSNKYDRYSHVQKFNTFLCNINYYFHIKYEILINCIIENIKGDETKLSYR